jgi:hypothetical protein
MDDIFLKRGQSLNIVGHVENKYKKEEPTIEL